MCTCLVVARNAHLRNQTYIYLTNLAITDMLTLLVGMDTNNRHKIQIFYSPATALQH